MIRHLLSAVVIAVVLLHTSGLGHLPLLETLENLSYDLRVRQAATLGVDQRVVIIDIDEASLNQVGRWPWSRDRVADLIDILFDEYGVSTLGFDMVFAEPDNSSGLDTLESLARSALKDVPRFLDQVVALRPVLQRDNLMAQSLKDKPVVMGFYFKSVADTIESSGVLPAPLMTVEDLGEAGQRILKARSYGGNLKVLQEVGNLGGFFDNPRVDSDGVFRRVPLLQEFRGQIYPSLAVAVARLLWGNPPFTIGPNTLGWTAGPEEKVDIPVDDLMSVLVPYRGPSPSFRYISAADILERKVGKDDLLDKVALVGTTAPGLMDLRSTPMQNVYPGVEVHANIISGIFDGRIMARPDYLNGLEVLTILFLGLVLAMTLPRLSPLHNTLMTLGLMAAVIGLERYNWHNGTLFFLASPLLVTGGLFILHMSYGFFVESQGKRQIAKVFGQYIPKELVDEMSASGQEFAIGGESREMSVLFSDVRGFTTISEGLKPDELTRLMNFFLTPMTHIIHQRRGTIDKYMGDAIMAFWGAPLRDARHAYHAVQSGLDMIKGMETLRDELAQKGWPPMKIGVGVNSGMMNVGNMGSEFRMAYTVLGDAVNLGSRLESLTKQYGVGFIIGEETRRMTPEFLCRQLDLVRVKGKLEPVAIFEPLGLEEEQPADLKTAVARYHEALDHYRRQDWDAAEKLLQELKATDPDRKIYDIYLERLAQFRGHPPGDGWDGVFTHTSK
ncbi:MAG: adenylate/guanylate cyclase domain-containing protein [Magnetococcales bacterium]|nr:adenylate/guanylate cyclase domain-containing protein [Magnetococcales bacterium]